jgi:hypothetical protein
MCATTGGENRMGETPSSLEGPVEPQGLRFLRTHWLRIMAISAILLVPCFWHKHIEAGDLASHTYNAWLAQLIERGQAPGLYLAPQWNNVLVDVALQRLGSALGLASAEKIVAATCVLIFFWGAFAVISAAARQRPWFLVPALAMITYGWTFQMGFMNYYLSLGIAFFAWALLWRGRGIDWIFALVLAGLTLVAHPIGFVCLIGAVAYTKLAEAMSGWRRWAVFAAAILAVVALHFYIVREFQTQFWYKAFFLVMNGADQLMLFGKSYAIPALSTLIFSIVCLVYAGRREGKDRPMRLHFRTPLELWAILLFTAAMVPELIQLSYYAAPVAFPIARLTSITAVMGLCMVGSIRPRKWHLAGFSAFAVVFFALLYRDTGVLNNMETQVEHLVGTLPYGQRVMETTSSPPDSRIPFINHIVDRACIARCFAYSNYEPSSGQFRIRVRPGSLVVADSPLTTRAMELGEYVVRPEDLPMTQIYQCDERDWTRLCRRELQAGEKNGRIGFHRPFPY